VKAAAIPSYVRHDSTRERARNNGRTLQCAGNQEANLIPNQGADEGENVEGHHGHLEHRLLAQGIPKAATSHEEATILCYASQQLA
jgi:hypothetical protein